MKYALIIVIVLAVILIGWKLLSNGGQSNMFAPSSAEPTSTVSTEEQQAAMQTFEKDSLPPQPGMPRN